MQGAEAGAASAPPCGRIFLNTKRYFQACYKSSLLPCQSYFGKEVVSKTSDITGRTSLDV